MIYTLIKTSLAQYLTRSITRRRCSSLTPASSLLHLPLCLQGLWIRQSASISSPSMLMLMDRPHQGWQLLRAVLQPPQEVPSRETLRSLLQPPHQAPSCTRHLRKGEDNIWEERWRMGWLKKRKTATMTETDKRKDRRLTLGDEASTTASHNVHQRLPDGCIGERVQYRVDGRVYWQYEDGDDHVN